VTPDPDDLIPIREASRILGRSIYTLRSWTRRGFAPSGAEIRCFRDAATNVRWYSRREIERVFLTLYDGKLPSRS